MRVPRSMSGVLLAGLAALTVAACGSSSNSSNSSAAASSSPASTSAAGGSTSSSASSSSAAGALPGKGKPALTLGTKNFTEEFIIGELYRQELQHYGYTINYKPNIGSTEIIDKSLKSGTIDAYPEYTGESYGTVLGFNSSAPSPQAQYDKAKAAYAKRGDSMSNFTPFQDVDALAVLKSYATAHNLHAVPDLKKLPSFTLGGQPPFLGRFQGAVGMKKVYGITNMHFKPLAVGLQYTALDSHDVNVADAFSTDPQLASGKYLILTDPKHIFGFQNVALVISTSKLSQLGGQTFLNIVDKVNTLLTTPAMIALNKAVAIDKQAPGPVAHAFLKANGLL